MQMKSKIENPTRKARALAMALAFALLGAAASCLSFSPPLSMNNMAATKLAKIAMKPMITMYVMPRIIA